MECTAESCRDGLTPRCFEECPAWAKQAFAYRLLHMLLPGEITKRLPKGLGEALIAPGVDIPPGVTFPPGTTIPPGYAFPPGWSAGDPVPTGITIPPGTSFPPGWSAGDPVPAGVILEPGATFPPGWSPGDPLPPSFGPGLPPGTIIPPGGVIPPTYLDPNDPGPRHRPSPTPTGKTYVVTFTAQNDGRIRLEWGTWNTIHDAATGGTIWTAGATGFPAIRARNSLGDYSITRSFLGFDLSSIPAAATVISCTLMVHGYIDANCNGILQEGSQGDSLALEDYDGFTGSQFDTMAFTTSPMTFTLNEAGKAYIKSKYGSTAKLCIREYDHDYLDVPPGMDETYQAGIYYSEATDPDNRPKLTVTYKY